MCQKGFTLLELLAVVGIMAILAAFALPRYGFLHRDYTLYGTVRGLSADLRYARQLAVDGGEGCTVEVDVDPGGYVVVKNVEEQGEVRRDEVKSVTFPPGVRAAEDYEGVVFNSLGSPREGRVLELKGSGGDSCRVEVSPGTGRVVIEW